jgi:hypothetical protein
MKFENFFFPEGGRNPADSPSKETIEKMLKNGNHSHPNIKLLSGIGTCATFLDLRIENKNGILLTSVYHQRLPSPILFLSNPIILDILLETSFKDHLLELFAFQRH